MPPPLTGVEISYPVGLGFALSELGLATCLPITLEMGGPEACPANSLMGYGTATAEIPVGPEIRSETARVTIVGTTEQSGHLRAAHLSRRGNARQRPTRLPRGSASCPGALRRAPGLERTPRPEPSRGARRRRRAVPLNARTAASALSRTRPRPGHRTTFHRAYRCRVAALEGVPVLRYVRFPRRHPVHGQDCRAVPTRSPVAAGFSHPANRARTQAESSSMRVSCSG